MTKWIQIQWTANAIEEARKIARALIEKRLVACVNMVPIVESTYLWEGKVETAREVEVLLKTREAHFEKVKSYIEAHASYAVPAILALPILKGNSAYLKWLDASVNP